MGILQIEEMFAAVLFLGILVSLEVGRRMRVRQRTRGLDHAVESPGFGAIEAAVFGLLGLLLAFTFSGAVGRFDDRRHLIVEEANDIGTAYLRLDLLAEGPRLEIQAMFREYVDARLATYRAIPNMEQVRAEQARVAALQGRIWTRAVQASRESPVPQAPQILLPALNSMFDIVTTRTAATQMHPPRVIYGMLAGLALLCSLLAGYGMGAVDRRGWLHIVCFAGILALTVYVIVDLEYPRLGLIRVDAFDQLLVDVRNGMR